MVPAHSKALRVGPALIFLLGAVACRFDPAGISDGDGGAPFDGGIDGTPGMCTPAVDQKCVDATTLQSCLGNEVVTTVCPDGCTGGPGAGAHCLGPQPSNGLDPAWLSGADTALEIPSGVTMVFDTGTGVIFDCAAGSFVRSAGTGLKAGIRFELLPATAQSSGIGAFALASLRVRGGGDLIAIGPNAFAVLAMGEIRLDDEMHVDAGLDRCSIETACGFQVGTERCAGAGGATGGSENVSGLGPGGGESIAGSDVPGVFEFGGGGAGFGSVGGHGGSNLGGPAGVVYGDPVCVPLIGGSGGGGGGADSTGFGGTGGGGGGAVHLFSFTSVKLGGMGGIEVGGGGGGPATGPGTVGGGGGGSGGAILLESPVLDLDGRLSANGGGGGAGNGIMTVDPELAGGDGAFGSTPAVGGDGAYPGGDGAAGTTGAQGGEPTGVDFDGSGGGGGGVGRISLRTVVGGLIDGNLEASPTPFVSTDLGR